MFEKGLVKSEEDETKLYTLIDVNGNLLAEAMLILHSNKIAIEPLSEDDKRTLEKVGYAILTIDEIKNIEL